MQSNQENKNLKWRRLADCQCLLEDEPLNFLQCHMLFQNEMLSEGCGESKKLGYDI